MNNWVSPIDVYHDSPEGKLRDRNIREHQSYCYGKDCISCGCLEERPCIYHKGSDRYKNELLERIAIAMEMAAVKGPE